MTKLEVRIIHNNCFSICSEKLENYLENLEDNEEKYNDCPTSTKVTFSQDKTPQRSVSKLEKFKSDSRPEEENTNISKEKITSSNLSTSHITEEDMLETDERIIAGDTDTISQSHEVTANVKKQTKIVGDTDVISQSHEVTTNLKEQTKK